MELPQRFKDMTVQDKDISGPEGKSGTNSTFNQASLEQLCFGMFLPVLACMTLVLYHYCSFTEWRLWTSNVNFPRMLL